jgi:hypothetical protein
MTHQAADPVAGIDVSAHALPDVGLVVVAARAAHALAQARRAADVVQVAVAQALVRGAELQDTADRIVTDCPEGIEEFFGTRWIRWLPGCSRRRGS